MSEQCAICVGTRTVNAADDLPLCNGHWNAFLNRYLGANDQPCKAHLIGATQ